MAVNFKFASNAIFRFFDHLDANIISESSALVLSRTAIIQFVFGGVFEKKIIWPFARLSVDGNGKDQVSWKYYAKFVGAMGR